MGAWAAASCWVALRNGALACPLRPGIRAIFRLGANPEAACRFDEYCEAGEIRVLFGSWACEW